MVYVLTDQGAGDKKGVSGETQTLNTSAARMTSVG